MLPRNSRRPSIKINSSCNMNLLAMHMNFELNKAGSEGNYYSVNLMPNISIESFTKNLKPGR